MSNLEAEVQSLRRQLEASPPARKKAPPKPVEEAPTNFTYLSDFYL
jgi:hypothetical protein